MEIETVDLKSRVFLRLFTKPQEAKFIVRKKGAEIMLQMQLQNMEEVPSLHSKGLWCNEQPQHTDQTSLKMCAVKLVDFRKPQGLNAKTSEENLPAEDKSSRFDGDQETLHAQLKTGLVRLVDCRKIQNRKATAELEPEDETNEHESNNTDFISSNQSRDQQTLHSQVKMSSVRLVDCRKIQTRKAKAEAEPEDETYAHESKNNDFIPSSKTSSFAGHQQTLEAQLKACLVKLVDCGKNTKQDSSS